MFAMTKNLSGKTPVLREAGWRFTHQTLHIRKAPDFCRAPVIKDFAGAVIFTGFEQFQHEGRSRWQ